MKQHPFKKHEHPILPGAKHPNLALKRAAVLALLAILLGLPAPVRGGEFEVGCDSLPAGWTPGDNKPWSFSASRQAESPQRYGQVSVSQQSPVTLEEAKGLVPPESSQAVTRWESTRFRERTAYIYHKRTDDEQPNYQGSFIEFDRYFIQVDGDTWARIDLDRSCSRGRAVMQDGSEIPPGTVAMPYEIKFIPVNYEGEVARLRSEQEAILNCLQFTVSGPGEPTAGTEPGPTSTDSDDSEEDPWGLVIGVGAVGVVAAGVAAVLAAAAIAAARKKPQGKTGAPPRKPKEKEKKKEPKPPVAYVLQLSKDQLQITEAAPAALTVQVWKVDPQSKTCQPATEAVIELVSPAGLPMLRLSSLPAPGRLNCQLQLDGPVQIPQAVLQVRAQAGGGSHAAEVRLTFDSPATMEFF